MRLAWLDKAKELLYPKLFFWHKWQNFSSHILPKFHVIGFQIGLRQLLHRRSKPIVDESDELESLSDTVNEVMEQLRKSGKEPIATYKRRNGLYVARMKLRPSGGGNSGFPRQGAKA